LFDSFKHYGRTTVRRLGNCFRDHFGRVAEVNAWTTDDDLIQHLTLALEEPAAEVLRDFDDTSPSALTELWARLENRYSELDSCRCASSRSVVSPTLNRRWNQYLKLHHRDLDFSQTVQKARIFYSTMEGGKKKAVRFVADAMVSHAVAS